MAKKNKLMIVDGLASVFLIAGAIILLLIGALNINIITKMFGSMSFLFRVIYIIIGVSGLYKIGSGIQKLLRL